MCPVTTKQCQSRMRSSTISRLRPRRVARRVRSDGEPVGLSEGPLPGGAALESRSLPLVVEPANGGGRPGSPARTVTRAGRRHVMGLVAGGRVVVAEIRAGPAGTIRFAQVRFGVVERCLLRSVALCCSHWTPSWTGHEHLRSTIRELLLDGDRPTEQRRQRRGRGAVALAPMCPASTSSGSGDARPGGGT